MSGGVRDVLVQHNVMRGDAQRNSKLFNWGPRVIVLKTGRGLFELVSVSPELPYLELIWRA